MKFAKFLLEEKKWIPFKDLGNGLLKELYSAFDFSFSSCSENHIHILLVSPEYKHIVIDEKSIRNVPQQHIVYFGLGEYRIPPCTISSPRNAVILSQPFQDGFKFQKAWICQKDIFGLIHKHGNEKYLDFLLSKDIIQFDEEYNILDKK